MNLQKVQDACEHMNWKYMGVEGELSIMGIGYTDLEGRVADELVGFREILASYGDEDEESDYDDEDEEDDEQEESQLEQDDDILLGSSSSYEQFCEDTSGKDAYDSGGD